MEPNLDSVGASSTTKINPNGKFHPLVGRCCFGTSLHTYHSKGSKVGERIVYLLPLKGRKVGAKDCVTQSWVIRQRLRSSCWGVYLIPNFQRGYNQTCYMLLSWANNPCKCNKIIWKCLCWVQSNGQRNPSKCNKIIQKMCVLGAK